MSKRFTRSIAAAGALAALAASAPINPAAAQYGYRIEPQEWQRNTKRPERGYEGFPAPGIYCSYRREPNRTCTTDKNGRERCKVTSWRLIQFCS